MLVKYVSVCQYCAHSSLFKFSLAFGNATRLDLFNKIVVKNDVETETQTLKKLYGKPLKSMQNEILKKRSERFDCN